MIPHAGLGVNVGDKYIQYTDMGMSPSRMVGDIYTVYSIAETFDGAEAICLKNERTLDVTGTIKANGTYFKDFWKKCDEIEEEVI